MTQRILSVRELNRATLARQMLLKRDRLSVPAAIERLVGLQAQVSSAPFIGLWTRLCDLGREALGELIENRTVVKATFMRATLHLVTAEDYVRFRTTLQPMLTSAGNAIAKRRSGEFNLEKVLAEARRYIGEKPRTFAEISVMVGEWAPDADVGAARYSVRTHLPLVQVPVSGGWGYPSKPEFALADSWLGRPVSTSDNLRQLVFRYLAAFGPASATDMQTWSGLPKLKETFEELRPELKTYRDENRRELFDLHDGPIPDSDVPAPARFLPEYDNLLLSHTNRTRVIPDEHRSRVFLPGLRVRGTILVDGFVGGAWRVDKEKNAAILVIEPFVKLTRGDRAALNEEAEKLVRFLEPQAKSFGIKVEE
ncbi:MAG: winged helix DNA-binding domain-containing protein [Acidobacteria bacterium]|nr:MAG: winged helix DNA-binding domain-containing protein [Acidobacteriota bacterium]